MMDNMRPFWMGPFIDKAIRSIYDPELIKSLCSVWAYDATHYHWWIRYDDFLRKIPGAYEMFGSGRRPVI